ncbi:hypothetical protein ACFYY2_29790 [Streptomyces sp. NPDC001822]|uniref:hypothetical protein n=1 Tax=Streptomyces sp. NPDC001822 TaxID=3364614 RepID=UPI0036B49752
MNIDDVVAAKVEAARRQIAERQRVRAELAAARKRGLAARHAQKLRHFAGQLDNHTPAASAA